MLCLQEMATSLLGFSVQPGLRAAAVSAASFAVVVGVSVAIAGSAADASAPSAAYAPHLRFVFAVADALSLVAAAASAVPVPAFAGAFAAGAGISLRPLSRRYSRGVPLGEVRWGAPVSRGGYRHSRRGVRQFRDSPEDCKGLPPR